MVILNVTVISITVEKKERCPSNSSLTLFVMCFISEKLKIRVHRGEANKCT